MLAAFGTVQGRSCACAHVCRQPQAWRVKAQISEQAGAGLHHIPVLHEHTQRASMNGNGRHQRIFLARHGERADLADADWLQSEEGHDDQYDAPLTARGLQQAHELGLRLQEEDISAIYSSPFMRALQTAHQVAEVLDLPVTIETGLSEGMLQRLFPEGPPNFKTQQDLASRMPRARLSDKQVVKDIPHPETYSEARRRCALTANSLAERHSCDSILLVGHGLSVEYLAMSLVHHKRKGPLDIPYCCLTECIRENCGHGDWKFGALMQQDFLSQTESKEEAQRQRKLWGLDDEA